MFTAQALRNRQHRLEAEMATPAWRPIETLPDPDYQADLDVADEVTFTYEVLEQIPVELDLEIVGIDDHGHYSIVRGRAEDGTYRTAEVGRPVPLPGQEIIGIQIRQKAVKQEPELDPVDVRKLKL